MTFCKEEGYRDCRVGNRCLKMSREINLCVSVCVCARKTRTMSSHETSAKKNSRNDLHSGVVGHDYDSFKK